MALHPHFHLKLYHALLTTKCSWLCNSQLSVVWPTFCKREQKIYSQSTDCSSFWIKQHSTMLNSTCFNISNSELANKSNNWTLHDGTVADTANTLWSQPKQSRIKTWSLDWVCTRFEKEASPGWSWEPSRSAEPRPSVFSNGWGGTGAFKSLLLFCTFCREAESVWHVPRHKLRTLQRGSKSDLGWVFDAKTKYQSAALKSLISGYTGCWETCIAL